MHFAMAPIGSKNITSSILRFSASLLLTLVGFKPFIFFFLLGSGGFILLLCLVVLISPKLLTFTDTSLIKSPSLSAEAEASSFICDEDSLISCTAFVSNSDPVSVSVGSSAN